MYIICQWRDNNTVYGLWKTHLFTCSFSFFTNWLRVVFYFQLLSTTLSEELVRSTLCPTRRGVLSPGLSTSAPNKAWSWLCPRMRRRTTYWHSSLGMFTRWPGSTSTLTKQKGILKPIWKTNLWPSPNGEQGSQTDPLGIQAAPCCQNMVFGDWHKNAPWMLTSFVKIRRVIDPLPVFLR